MNGHATMRSYKDRKPYVWNEPSDEDLEKEKHDEDFDIEKVTWRSLGDSTVFDVATG